MKFIHLPLVVLSSICLSGCLNNVEDISETSDYDPSEISYSADIQPILTQSCGGNGCHINSSTNGVNVASYQALINSTGSVYGEDVINPGNPDQSPLVDKIEPAPRFGNRMPQGGPYLTTDEISKIRAWVLGGAEDN